MKNKYYLSANDCELGSYQELARICKNKRDLRLTKFLNQLEQEAMLNIKSIESRMKSYKIYDKFVSVLKLELKNQKEKLRNIREIKEIIEERKK